MIDPSRSVVRIKQDVKELQELLASCETPSAQRLDTIKACVRTIDYHAYKIREWCEQVELHKAGHSGLV